MNEPRFPTRNFPYRWPAANAGPVITAPVAPGKVYAFRLGLDAVPQEVGAAGLALLNDPMATLVLRPGKRPMTLHQLLAEVNAYDEGPLGLQQTQSFVVAEGGLITPPPQGFSANARLVVARGKPNLQPTLFISTTAPFDSRGAFLQVLAWDAIAGAFQFYERRNGSWIWAGSSWDALVEPTRGIGPFDSHINGAMVMKELKAPWMHWHSMAQTLPDTIFQPPARHDPLFVNRRGGEILERIVRNGVDNWTRSRLDRILAQPVVHPEQLLRQIVTTTSVNIVSSTQEFDGDPDEIISVPLSFVCHTDALFNLLNFSIAPELHVTRARYKAAITTIAQTIADAQQAPPFQRAGDVFFCWSIPEPAYEDFSVMSALVERGVLSAQFVGALLMLDFSNPVFSAIRATLMAQAPSGPISAGDIEPAMRVKIAAAAAAGDAAAAHVAHDLAMPEAQWRAESEQRVSASCAAVQAHLNTDAGLQALLRLADSRRRQFRERPLAEFDLTLPWLANAAGFLRLRPDGTTEAV